MRTNIKGLAAALLIAATAAGLPSVVLADAEDGDTEERCRSVDLEPDRARTYRYSYQDQEPGLVTVKASSGKVDLYVLNADDEVVCSNIGEGEVEQSCIWVADGDQRYKARIVNVSATPGWDGVTELGDGNSGNGNGNGSESSNGNNEDEEEGVEIDVDLCFVSER